MVNVSLHSEREKFRWKEHSISLIESHEVRVKLMIQLLRT